MKKWIPQPKQEQALMSKCFETLYGGARGGGKTDTGQAFLLYNYEHPLLRELVIRKNAEDLKDWIDRAKRMYSGTGAIFTGKPAEIKFPSGAKIITGHLKDDNAFEKYQGHEYHRLLIEELTQIPTEERYMKLISSCRSTIKELPAQIFATTNPGGVGHRWVKKRFVDVAKSGDVYTDTVSHRTRIFIQATVDDNKFLMENDPDYVTFLDSLPEDLKQQWRFGSWESVEIKGAYFTKEINIANKEGRIGFVDVDDNLLVHTAWDLGLGDSQVCVFFQLEGQKIKIIDLHYSNNQKWSYYTRILREKGYRYGTHYLPHDGTKRNPETLSTFKTHLEENGYTTHIIPRTKDKNADIRHARIMFSRCFFGDKAEYLVEALTNYRQEWKEDRGILLDMPYHDWSSHPVDAFLCLCRSIPDTLVKKNSDVMKKYYRKRKVMSL